MTIKNEFEYLTPKELKQWTQEKISFILIHTLTNNHFQKVHLPGARNACVFEVNFLDQMNAIENMSLEGDELQPVLVSHLKSEDFFLVKLFPTATFIINGGKLDDEPYLSSPNYEVDGTLDLRDLKADLSFPSTITNTDDNGLVAEAHFDIDRTRWNVIYG